LAPTITIGYITSIMMMMMMIIHRQESMCPRYVKTKRTKSDLNTPYDRLLPTCDNVNSRSLVTSVRYSECSRETGDYRTNNN